MSLKVVVVLVLVLVVRIPNRTDSARIDDPFCAACV